MRDVQRDQLKPFAQFDERRKGQRAHDSGTTALAADHTRGTTRGGGGGGGIGFKQTVQEPVVPIDRWWTGSRGKGGGGA